jgi:hypothetical protein
VTNSTLITGWNGKFTILVFPTQCLLYLLSRVGRMQGKALGSAAGKECWSTQHSISSKSKWNHLHWIFLSQNLQDAYWILPSSPYTWCCFIFQRDSQKLFTWISLLSPLDKQQMVQLANKCGNYKIKNCVTLFHHLLIFI